MKFQYLTSCVHSTAEKIHSMVDNAREVTLGTIRRHCDIAEWEKAMGYSTGSERGLHLKDDWAVSYHKGKYDGVDCYYIRHSLIEHIWINQ